MGSGRTKSPCHGMLEFVKLSCMLHKNKNTPSLQNRGWLPLTRFYFVSKPLVNPILVLRQVKLVSLAPAVNMKRQAKNLPLPSVYFPVELTSSVV
jgi:hypothetical protein